MSFTHIYLLNISLLTSSSDESPGFQHFPAQERELKVTGNIVMMINHSVFTSKLFLAMGTHFLITFDSLMLAISMARAANKMPPKYSLKKLLHLTNTNRKWTLDTNTERLSLSPESNNFPLSQWPFSVLTPVSD